MFLTDLVGVDNLLLTEGAEHTKHRRMINPAFHHTNLREMLELMVTETDQHVAQWVSAMTSQSSGSSSAEPFVQLDLHREMSALTFAVISRCAFGTTGAADTTLIYDAFAKILKAIQWRVVRLVPLIPVVRDLPILHHKDITEGKAQIWALAERIIRDRKEGKTGREKGARQDLLDLLLEAADPTTGGKLTDTEVRDEAMTFVFAGHETTANLVSWMLHVCMARPQLWQELTTEVDAVCREEPLGYTDLTQLPILDAVINETLRYFPPVPNLQREVSTAHVLGGQTDRPVHMPAGARLQVEFTEVHRDPRYWGDTANTFDHTRWLQTGKRPYSHPYAFLPFSSGARNCIGLNFAQLEAKVIMVRVLQRTRMEWVAGQKLDKDGWAIPVPVVTLRPKYGMQVRIYERSDREQRARQPEETKAG